MQTLMLINSQNNTYMRLRALPNIRYDESRELGQYFFAHIFCSFLFNNVTFFMDLELLVGLETYISTLLQTTLHIFHLFPIFINIFALPLFYILISVRSWNFKDGGSLKASFLAKNQHATKEKSLKKSYD